MSKGDTLRPYDAEKYSVNYDSIFRSVVKDVCGRCADCECMEDRDFDSHDEATYQEKQ